MSNDGTGTGPQSGDATGGNGQPPYGQPTPPPQYGQPQAGAYGAQPYGSPQYGQPGDYAPDGPGGVSAQPVEWPKRAIGYLVDISPNIALGIIGNIAGVKNPLYYVCSLLSLVIWAINRWVLGGPTGQSWGRKAVGTKLVREDNGQPLGIGMTFVRDVCHIVDAVICYVGFLWPLWDGKRQTLADKIIKTVVVPAGK